MAAIPDSLTSVFYTSKKRPVRDGGGVRPEFEVKEPKVPTMMYYLAADTVLFDFVTDWAQSIRQSLLSRNLRFPMRISKL